MSALALLYSRASLLIKLTHHKEGVILPVKARAGARRNEIRGVHDGALKIAVRQVAEKGKANRAIVELLSQSLGIPKSDIELIHGGTSSNKQLLLRNAKADWLHQQLAVVLEKSH